MSEIVQNQYSSWQAENSGKWIYNGFIYVGKVDTDPQISANQVRVYYIDENEQEVGLDQPIRTNSSGFPVISETNSTVIQIRTDGDYSVKVLNRKGEQEWYIPKASSLSRVIEIDHNETKNRSAVGAHDDIYLRSYENLKELRNSTDFDSSFINNNIQVKNPYGVWRVQSSVTTEYNIPLQGGLFAALLHPQTLKAAGIVSTELFDEDIAASNRLIAQGMLRDTRFAKVSAGITGNVWILGSVNVGRSDFEFEIEKGCFFKGRYNTTNYPPARVNQAGHMFGFVNYTDPDNNDFTIAGSIENIKVTLDGDVETVFNSSQVKTHGNNCIGFFNADNSSVFGVGGVSGSDHRGINFDGECDNAAIDVAYVKGCSNIPIGLKGSSTSRLSTCRIKFLGSQLFDGGLSPACIQVRDNAAAKIIIESHDQDFISDALHLVISQEVGDLTVIADEVENLGNIIRFRNTENITLMPFTTPIEMNNINNIIEKTTEAETVATKSIFVDSVTDSSGETIGCYNATGTSSTFDKLTIKNCDFSNSPSTFEYFRGLAGSNEPTIYDINSNESPPSYTASNVFYNVRFDEGDNLISGTPSFFSWNVNSPDRSYKKLSLRVSDSGNLYLETLYVPLLLGTSTTIKVTIGASDFDITRSGTTLTLTRVSGTGVFINAIPHN